MYYGIEIPSYNARSYNISSWLIICTAILIIVLPFLYIYYDKMKKNHKKIFKIEDVIIQNYDYINGKSNDEKNCILEELRQIFTNKKDVDRLMRLLSESGRN